MNSTFNQTLQNYDSKVEGDTVLSFLAHKFLTYWQYNIYTYTLIY